MLYDWFAIYRTQAKEPKLDDESYPYGLDDAHLLRVQTQERGKVQIIQTLHVALTLVDNFFQVTSNLPKADFQLTGAASLFIAAKL
jgi:hypothetical protein